MPTWSVRFGAVLAALLGAMASAAAATVHVTAAPGGLGTTGLQWQLDDDPPAPAGSPAATGKAYGPALVWSRLGQVRLRPGKHTLTLAVPVRGEGAERYSLSVDALVLAREPFVPEGASRPTWRPREKP